MKYIVVMSPEAGEITGLSAKKSKSRNEEGDGTAYVAITL